MNIADCGLRIADCGLRIVLSASRSHRAALGLFVALIFGYAGSAYGIREWIVGGDEHPWEDSGILHAVDAVADPGWIQPLRSTRELNLSLDALERGGRGVYSDQPSVQSLGDLDFVIDGDPETAFFMSLQGTVGTFIILDLGATFPVARIRFYPRAEFEDRFIRGYQIFASNGPMTAGQLPWTLVAPKWQNDQSTVTVRTGNRYARYIKVQSVSILPWEIAELEVYGEGYAPSATYTSDVINLGGPANFGHLRWHSEADPQSEMALATRSGHDPAPYSYYRLDRPEIGVVDTVEVSEDDYSALKEEDRLRVFDMENWSFWSAPYAPTGDEQVVSPAPRRYVQFQIQFKSEFFAARARVDSLLLEYSTPPVAQEVVAEIAPDVVHAGQDTTFAYGLRARRSGGETGFDALRIQTPTEATILGLKIGGENVVFSREPEIREREFTVYFPPVLSEELVELTFQCKVLVYGTVFSAWVFDSSTSELPQEVVPGDASPAIATHSLRVGVSRLGDEIVDAVNVIPSTVTPNGDGRNDVATIQFQLLKLLDPAPVTVAIYDLSGRVIWEETRDLVNGTHVVLWDGTDRDGRQVRPGIYLYEVCADAAVGEDKRSGVVCVAY